MEGSYVIEMATTEEAKKKDNEFERRCPSCGWFLWTARGVEGTGSQVIEIQARCANRKCKRRDKHKLESYKA